MATTALFDNAVPGRRSAVADLRAILTVLACAALAPGLFGLVNLGAEALGILPLFFAPFGMPGWIGGAAHLTQLAMLGAAYGALILVSAPRARLWLAALIAAYIALPFITPPLDSLQLSLVCTGVFLLGLATLIRVGKASPLAGWLLAPTLAIVGFSASMGLVLSVAYSPPFALIQGNGTPTPTA
jgi:hypothetical protein